VHRELAELPAELRGPLEREVLPLRTLERVVRWAFGQTPPSDVADIVVQDEFTHDVIIPWRGVHLVFDTT